MFSILKKSISASILFSVLFFQGIPISQGVSADLGSLGKADVQIEQNDSDISDMMTAIEERYHINKEALQNYGEGMNVSDNKKTTPEVSLFFSPKSPVPGEDITVMANTLYFNSDKNNLYFTWYLKHKECEKKSSVNHRDTDREKKLIADFCDLDDDNDIDENDWKITATRLLVNAGFDWENAKYDERGYTEDRDGYETQNLFGGDQGFDRGNAYCYAQDSTTGTLYELATPQASTDPNDPTPRSASSDCKHYFPDTKGSGTVGNGSFDRDEEKFWRTDPYDPDTAGTGHPDEANVVGLGRDSFTWKYAVGDTVGVMAEGVSSIPSKHNSASYGIMWAISKEKCSVTPNGSYTEKIKGYDVTFLTGTQDMDTCIEKSLVDPREGGQTERMKLALAYSPKFISNDTSADAFGDTATITSSVENTEADQSTLKYEWKVYIDKNGSYDPRGFSLNSSLDTTSNWIDITRFLRIHNLIPAYTGNGIASLPVTFNLTSDLFKNYTGRKNPSDQRDPYTDAIKNLRVYLADTRNEASKTSVFGNDRGTRDKVGTAYFKISVQVSENINITGRNAIEGNKRTASANIIIPVSRMGDNEMTVKKVDVNANNKLIVKQDPSTRRDRVICNERSPLSSTEATTNFNYLGIGRNLCLVVKNEILNLSLDNRDGSLQNFQWTSNGEPLPCSADMAETTSSPIKPLCSDDQESNTTFLPVTGDVGQVYDVNVSALDSESGKRISISRAFQVIDPYATITPTDKNKVWQKYLGYYKKTESDGKIYAYENLSTTRFQTFPETVASFRVTFPSGIGDRTKYRWIVDGTKVSDSEKPQDPDKVQVLLSGNPGTVHTLTVEGYAVENGRIRNALSQFWDASLFETAEQQFSSTIEIEIVANEEESALASPKSFFAAIVKNAPKQILFIFELFLSVSVIIILLSLIFSIGTKENE